jgi:hypothetical protein
VADTSAYTAPATTVERSDHRCGPNYGGAKCGPSRCCSSAGWCGGPGGDHCTRLWNAPLYNGPGAVII